MQKDTECAYSGALVAWVRVARQLLPSDTAWYNALYRPTGMCTVRTKRLSSHPRRPLRAALLLAYRYRQEVAGYCPLPSHLLGEVAVHLPLLWVGRSGPNTMLQPNPHAARKPAARKWRVRAYTGTRSWGAFCSASVRGVCVQQCARATCTLPSAQ